MKKFVALAIAAAAALASSLPVQAQERRLQERRDQPSWLYDGRYGHRHYYPAVGTVVASLPPGHVVVNFQDQTYFLNAGVWFTAHGTGYLTVRPPVGIFAPQLPPAHTVVWAAGVPYYYANEVYYLAQGGGYVVAPAPAAQAPPPASAGASTLPPPGTWHYCESARTYYPYVESCPEGWRRVPAAPRPH
jgi:uncharacterized protein DUF6515